MGERLRIALAMWEGLAPFALGADQRARLDAVADVLDDVPLERFDDPRAPDLLARCDVLLGHWGCPRIDRATLTLAPQLRMIAYAAGTVKDTVAPEVWDSGILITSAAAANAVPVAEYTLAAILFANKGVFIAREHMRDSEVTARRPWPVGNWDKRIGIIGASHVGRHLIALLRPFAMRVVVADPFLSEAEASTLGVDLVDLDTLLRTSDVVSVHAPSLPSTRGMIGASQLAAMKDGAVLINTARGALVDTDALTETLLTGRISAILDVTDPEPLPTDSPLYGLPNVFLTPHIAGSQGNELARLADLAVEEVERFAHGEPARYPVRAADLDRIA